MANPKSTPNPRSGAPISPALVALLWTLAGVAVAVRFGGDGREIAVGLLLGAGIGLVGWSTGTVAGGLVIGALGALWGLMGGLLGVLLAREMILATVGTVLGLVVGGSIWGLSRLIGGLSPRRGDLFLFLAAGLVLGASLGLLYAALQPDPGALEALGERIEPDRPLLVALPSLLLFAIQQVGALVQGTVIGGGAGFLCGLLLWIVLPFVGR